MHNKPQIVFSNSLPGLQQQLVFNLCYFQPSIYFKRHSGNWPHLGSRLPKHITYKLQSCVL